MSVAYALSPSEIRQIFQPRPSNASRLWELAEVANSLAATVEERWGELSQERRELLADFAYQAIDPPSGLGAKLHSFLNRCYGAWMVLQGEQDAFVAYASASDRLTNAIIRAIERENRAYQEALSQAIEGALAEGKPAKGL